MIVLSEKELHFIQHALGLDKYGRGIPYRNYYCHPKIKSDVVDGLLNHKFIEYCDINTQAAYNNLYDVYKVTKIGITHALYNSPPPPKKSRGKLTYQAYRELQPDMSFIEFVQHEDYAEYIKDYIKEYAISKDR